MVGHEDYKLTEINKIGRELKLKKNFNGCSFRW